jgi:hypothetical protein
MPQVKDQPVRRDDSQQIWLFRVLSAFAPWAADELREMRKAKIGVVAAMVLGASGWWWLTDWLIYSPQIDGLKTNVGQLERDLGRYRVALGIDQATGGALIELTNTEMKAKAATTSAKLRDFEVSYKRRSEALKAEQAAVGNLDKESIFNQQVALMREVSGEFRRTLRADAINVDNELRRRLGPRGVASIVGLPPSFYSASDGAPIGVIGLTTSTGNDMDAEFVGTLANGIDQMAQLLPENK